MKQIRNRTANIILLAALAFGLIGCGQSANIEEELPEEERPEPRLIYQTKTAEIAAGNEAVLFQQGCEEGQRISCPDQQKDRREYPPGTAGRRGFCQ